MKQQLAFYPTIKFYTFVNQGFGKTNWQTHA